MKSPRSRILALLATLLPVVASLQLATLFWVARADRERGETNERGREGKESHRRTGSLLSA
jgi:hypothetical protein